MNALLHFIDSGAYHARTYEEIAHNMREVLEWAAANRLVTKGRFGYTLTTRGFYRAFADFTAGDGSC